MRIEPLGNRIILSIKEQDNKTQSGIIVPSCSAYKGFERRVFAIEVGPDVKRVKQGDEIIVQDHMIRRIHMGGDNIILFIDEPDVLGIVKA